MAQIDIKQIRGASQGSILFIGTYSTVTEDVNKLSWNQSQNRLTVVGSIAIQDGTQNDNYILISDSQGVASWTASTPGTSGTSGTSGSSGTSGTSGTSGFSGTSGTSGTGFSTISGAGDNKILTSDGTTNSANAESNLTFDGSLLTVTGDLLVTGSFSILGSSSTINTTNLVVSDSIIVLSHSQSIPSLDSGIFIDRGTGATQALYWNENTDVWTFASTTNDHTSIDPIDVITHSNIRAGGAEFNSLKIKNGATNNYILVSDSVGLSSWTSSSSLNLTTGSGTINYVPKWNSTTGLSNSSIIDDGQTVSINSKLQTGTGSIALGTYSHAEGYNTTSIGRYSHSEGQFSVSVGTGSHAEGRYSRAYGVGSNVQGYANLAFNPMSRASGNFSVTGAKVNHLYNNGGIYYNATLKQIYVRGDLRSKFSSGSKIIWAHSDNLATYESIVSGTPTYVTQSNNISYGAGGDWATYSSWHYTGYTTITIVDDPTGGVNDIWTNEYGFVVTDMSSDDLDYNWIAYAEGANVIARGHYSQANGLYTNSNGQASHTEGVWTQTEGLFSHAEGWGTITFGNYSHAEGHSSRADGYGSHAEGLATRTIGNYSHAEGLSSTAIGTYSHAEGIGTIAYSEGQLAVGKWNTATNSTDLFVIGNGTSSSNRSDLAKFSTDSITFNKSLILKDGTQGAGKILVSDSNGLASWTASSSNINIGNVLYVSKNGNDSTASKGRIDKPWVSIQSARDSASSGDVIYVLPGTWTYDNRNSTGNQYNGVVDSMVNLWKDGLTYYFSPGTKIIIYNQTITGADMYLFRPNSAAFSKCSVLGHLEFEQYSTGTDTYNGRCNYLLGSVASTDYGYEFYSETKSLKSECSELILYDRSTSLTNTTKVDIVSDYEEVIYIDGQSGSGSAYRIRHIGTDNLVLTTSVRKRRYAKAYAHYYTTNNKTRIEMNSEEIYIVGGTNGGTYMPQTGALESGGLFLFYESNGSQINCYSGVIYYCTARINWYFGAIVTSIGGGNWSMNIKADLIDSNANSHSTGMFYIISGSCSLNFGGNIVTNTNGGTVPAGRFIAYTNASNTTINIKGDIDFIGTETTRNSLFQSNGGSVINYTGKIKGNFAGTLAKTFNGTVNILDSYVMSVIESSDAMIAKNGGTYSGTFRMSNSYIQLKNDTYTMCNGSYVKTLINNSTIINTGSQSVFYNISGQDNLQILNSTIITNGTMSINYGQTSSVISSNSVTNKNFIINNIYGNINVIDSLIY